MLPFITAAELEVAGILFGRVVRNAIQCRNCGVHYSLIVPAAASGTELASATEELREHVSSTCGRHPPMIQKQ
jgi:hypothetical protein